jgi:hypothetical protein
MACPLRRCVVQGRLLEAQAKRKAGLIKAGFRDGGPPGYGAAEDTDQEEADAESGSGDDEAFPPRVEHEQKDCAYFKHGDDRGHDADDYQTELVEHVDHPARLPELPTSYI